MFLIEEDKGTLWDMITTCYVTSPMMIPMMAGELAEEDRTGTSDRGAKSWGSVPSLPEEDSSWSSWLLPMLLAFLASMAARYVFANE